MWIEGATSDADGSRPAVYVAEHDASYMRYERYRDGSWTVREPGGTVYRFGEPTYLGGYRHPERMPLTSITSLEGDTVVYRWRPWSNALGTDLVLDRIDYGANRPAGIADFARVRFEYASTTPAGCGGSASLLPVGARLDYRTGLPLLYGSQKLSKIVTEVRQTPSASYRRVREIALAYDDATERCDSVLHAPYRNLVSLQETARSADGTTTTLPPIRFDYADAVAAFPVPVPFDFGTQASSQPLARGGAGISSMLLDVDGDAIVDRVRMVVSDCTMAWNKGTGAGFEPEPRLVSLARIPLAALAQRNGCDLSGQNTWLHTPGLRFDDPRCSESRGVGTVNRYRWMDVTGDGAVDLVTAIEHDAILYDPNGDPGVPNPPGCRAVTPPSGPGVPGRGQPGVRRLARVPALRRRLHLAHLRQRRRRAARSPTQCSCARRSS